MCGIAGIINFKQDLLDNKNFLIHHMLDRLVHRGPDELGIVIKKHFTLGIRRLKVIALENGAQPCMSNDESLIIAFNGEIYNYLSLKHQLHQKGYFFRTDTDAEVIVNLYHYYRDEFYHLLDGMFAIAIYDIKNNECIIARDPVGKKPLFYYFKDSELSFSSEIHSLISNTKIEKHINYQALDYFLQFRYIPSTMSIYQNIAKVQPGTVLKINNSGITESVVWQADYNENESELSQNKWLSLLDEALNESVKKRLSCEVPLGTMLSGGLDSGLITALAVKNSNKQIYTFSIGFHDSDFNELHYADRIAKALGTIHDTYIISELDALVAADKLIKFFGEPFAFPSSIACFYMFKLAAKKITVALGGDGADELFGGYTRYQYVNQFPNTSLNSKLPRHVDFNNNQQAEYFSNFYMKLLTDGLTKNIREKIYSTETKKRLIEQLAETSLSNRFAVLHKNTIKLNAALEFDFNHWMRDAQLVKVDIASMANATEVREPFLDKEVVKLAMKIPSHLKIKNGKEKYLLSELAKKYLPDYIINRKKQELALPIENWLHQSSRKIISDVITSDMALSRGYFNPDALINFVQNFQKNDCYAIWTLYILEKWHQQIND